MGLTVAEIREMLQRADEVQLASLERSLAADSRKGVRQAVEVARRRVQAEAAERARLQALYDYQRSLAAERGSQVVVGLDEVGRGPLAGPLAVGAVVLRDDEPIAGLNDSKQVAPAVREQVAEQVKARALAWAVEYVQPGDIDRLGMTAALRLAFGGALQAVEAQGVCPDLVLVDGNPLHLDPRELNVVKGDAKCASIAAASIVAKVERDALMVQLDSTYPGYGFAENKGYASPQHMEALRALGLSAVHRVSFCRSFMQETLF